MSCTGIGYLREGEGTEEDDEEEGEERCGAIAIVRGRWVGRVGVGPRISIGFFLLSFYIIYLWALLQNCHRICRTSKYIFLDNYKREIVYLYVIWIFFKT
jgi:hypothetical protein